MQYHEVRCAKPAAAKKYIGPSGCKPEKLFAISSYYRLGLQMEYDLFVARQLETGL